MMKKIIDDNYYPTNFPSLSLPFLGGGPGTMIIGACAAFIAGDGGLRQCKNAKFDAETLPVFNRSFAAKA